MPAEVVAPPTVVLQGWLPLFGILVALLAPLGPAIFGVFSANRNAKRAGDDARAAAAATEQVAIKLDNSDKRTSEKLDTIHSLVNSRLTAALEKIDALEQRLFETTGIEPTGEEPPKPPAHPNPPYPGMGPSAGHAET
jgi:hypothetical protein